MKETLKGREWKSVKYGLLLIIGILILVGGYLIMYSESEPDTRYLMGTPCAIPCWEGITPGVTDEKTALTIITDSNLVEQDSIKSAASQRDLARSGYVYRRSAGGSGSLSINEGTVYRIDIRPSSPPPLFSDIVDVFGPPDLVQIDSKTDEGICYDVNLYYILRGLWVSGGGCYSDNEEYAIRIGNSEEPNEANVHPHIPTSNLTLFQPGETLEAILTNSLLLDAEATRHIATYSNSWTGFGFYPVSPVHISR